MKWILIPVLIFLHTIIQARTIMDKLEELQPWLLSVELETSVLPISGIRTFLVAVTDHRKVCSAVCFEPGVHIGLAKDQKHGDNYFFAGGDFYARITGGSLWQRWGIGLTFFDRQTEELQTPWAIHASMQSGLEFDEWGLVIGFHHWSNGKGGAERLHLDQYWPTKNGTPTNGGGNAFTAGVIWLFE